MNLNDPIHQKRIEREELLRLVENGLWIETCKR